MKMFKVFLCVCAIILICSACGNQAETELPEEEAVQQTETAVPEKQTEEVPFSEEEEMLPVEPVKEEWPFAPYDAEGIWVYFPNEEGTDLASERLADDTDLARLIEELKQKAVLSLDTNVVELVAGTATEVNKDGETLSIKPSNKETVQLNLSEEYLHTFEGVTPKEERLKVKALVNTVIKYLGADEMELLCDGEYIETECYDYRGELSFTEPK